MITGTLENWYTDVYHNVLWGNLYEDIHNRWPDGQHIHTSDIQDLAKADLKKGDKVVTRNSVYRLGNPLK